MVKNETIPTTIKQESSASIIKKPIKTVSLRKSMFFVLILLMLIGLYGSVHFYNKYKSMTVDQNAEAKKVTDGLILSLSKLMELPVDEAPTVATISDKEKLAGQPFFKSAENGDILFAYTTAMKAILYRPSSNRIINVAPISINQSAPNTAITNVVRLATNNIPAGATKSTKK